MSLGHILGLRSLGMASYDAWILLGQRFLRMMAYGQTALILGLFFQTINVPDHRIGLFMSLTLLGDVVLSWILTFHADQLGRRFVLKLGAFAMMISGIIFALSSNYWFLLIAAVFGVISPSGSEIGPFKAIEESTLVHLTDIDHLPDLFAWHGIIGTIGSALGSLSAGFIVGNYGDYGLRIVFWCYAALACLKFGTSFILSEKCEETDSVQAVDPGDSTQSTDTAEAVETTALLAARPAQSQSLGPPKSLLILLCILFGLDSLGDGFMNSSWLVIYFVRRFGISESYLGTVLFFTTIIGSFTQILSSHVSKAIGPILAMVFTKLPSAMAGTAVGLVSNVHVAICLLLIRTAADPMDVVPRQLFLSTIVAPKDRTKVMGAVNVVKTLAKTIGPFVTGIVAAADKFWIAFVLLGICEGTYAVSLVLFSTTMKFRERFGS